MMKRTATIGLITLILSILLYPTASSAKMEFTLGEGGPRLLIEGHLYNQSLLRSKDFKVDKSLSLVSSRFVPQLELTLENLLTNFGPIDKVDFHTEIRPIYEGIYDMRDGAWGDDSAEFTAPFGHFENRGRASRRAGNFRFMDFSPFRGLGIPTSDIPFDRLHGYKQSSTRNELRWERTAAFDDWPFRELYFDVTAGKHWLRLGKQQIVWGKADNFRLQDIPNPVDFGIHSFLESWEDIRIPQWYINYQYQFGPRGPFENMALQLIANLDDFDPIGIGQVGQPWATALSYEGGRVGTAFYNYTKALRNDQIRANRTGTAPRLLNLFTSDFTRGIFNYGCADPTRCVQRFSRLGGSQILERAHTRRAFSLKNLEWGTNLEFLIKGWRFAFTYFNGFQDIPVDHVITAWSARNPDPITGVPWGGVIEWVYPKKSTFGLAMDYFEPYTSTVWRIESAYTPNKLLENWNHQDMNSEHNVFEWVIGIDRPTVGGPLFKWINPSRQVFVTGQIFGSHIFNHEGGKRTGVAADQNTFMFTFALSTNYFHDRLNPSWFIAWSPNYRATTSGGAIEYLVTDHWSAKVGFNVIAGHHKRHYEGVASGFIPGHAALGLPNLGDSPSPNRPNFSVPYRDLQEVSIGVAREGFGDYLSRQNDEVFFRLGYRF
ncbi:MAG: hypothetical protein HYY20_08620 [Candidatus Tectomicrobia bacterium]|uniref:Uncharacterized protein n=1 Tax=Tectimicrobiota bacterium TaxID=2528274 RepID=A0A932CPH9_UNCTE|nr:hypothetical protein [Candidatus Tectomicrobia bacterium]